VRPKFEQADDIPTPSVGRCKTQPETHVAFSLRCRSVTAGYGADDAEHAKHVRHADGKCVEAADAAAAAAAAAAGTAPEGNSNRVAARPVVGRRAWRPGADPIASLF
jgi:hypothetical protein